jgi:hypothetical protein
VLTTIGYEHLDFQRAILNLWRQVLDWHCGQGGFAELTSRDGTRLGRTADFQACHVDSSIVVFASRSGESGSNGRGERGLEDLGVTGGDGETAAQRLRDDDAVEGIFVGPGESAGQNRVG